MTNAKTMARVRALAETGAARSIRQASRLSLAEIARECGVDVSTVSRWETGHRRPRGDAALRYANVLDQLMSGG